MRTAWLLLLGLLSSAPALAQQDGDGDLVPPERVGDVLVTTPLPLSDSEAVEAFRSSNSFDDLERALRELQESHTNRLELIEIGASGKGRPLMVAALGERRVGDARHQPSLLLIPSFESSSTAVAGTHAAFELLIRLLRGPSSIERSTVFERGRLYLLLAPQPDLLPGRNFPERTPSTQAHPNRNFPIEWDPWLSADEAPGPYPLSEPETRALAQFLLEREELCAVVVLGEEGLPFDRLREADANLIRELHPSGTNGGPSPPVRPGSFAAFAYACAGLFVVPAEIPDIGGEQNEWGVLAELGELETLMRELARRLPALELGVPTIERLGPDLWRLELEVANSGWLPTASTQARATVTAGVAGAPGGVVLSLEGARLLAVAERRAGALTPQLVQGLDLGTWEGAERRTLDVFLEAPGGTSLTLRLESPRAGRGERAVTLP